MVNMTTSKCYYILQVLLIVASKTVAKPSRVSMTSAGAEDYAAGQQGQCMPTQRVSEKSLKY